MTTKPSNRAKPRKAANQPTPTEKAKPTGAQQNNAQAFDAASGSASLAKLRAAIARSRDEECDESKWPKGDKRTQRWCIYKSAVIRTLDRVLEAIDRGSREESQNVPVRDGADKKQPL